MRIIVAILAIAACLFLMQTAARFGFSRLIGRYALVANSVPAADEAVRISPFDPDAHRVRATVLTRQQQYAEAVKSLEAATRLRSRDDVLWLELGNAREEVGDTAGALAAFDQAVRWAPYYAHTHWQRGNLLLRMGRTSEAFGELRTAVEANHRYLPNLIDLAWNFSRGDLETTIEFIGIKDDAVRLALIRYLFAAKAFSAAFKLWTPSTNSPKPELFNGGFEDSQILNEPGFGGWFLTPGQSKIKVAIDVSEKFAGTKSLQLNFEGDWTPGTPLISQTLLVDPSKTYPISFSIKTKALATGGPLILTVHDADNGELLGKSDNFPSTDSWVTLNFEFTTLETSEAAVIRLQRSNCNSSPCPIFGTVWLDEIVIGQSR